MTGGDNSPPLEESAGTLTRPPFIYLQFGSWGHLDLELPDYALKPGTFRHRKEGQS